MANRTVDTSRNAPTPPLERRQLFRTSDQDSSSVSQDTDDDSDNGGGSSPARQSSQSRRDTRPAIQGRKALVPRRDSARVSGATTSARVPKQRIATTARNVAKKSLHATAPPLKGSAKRKSGAVVKKKATTPRRRDNATREIQRYQKGTELLMQKLPFSRLVREISQQCAIRSPIDAGNRWTVDAMWCIQEAAEAYLVFMLEEAYLFTLHARRLTLMPRDIRLWKRLQNPNMVNSNRL